MITFWLACLYQLENSLFCAVIVMLSILIGGESDRWYKIIDENSPFRNPFFLTYMACLWFLGCPWLMWYYQIQRYGLWEPLYRINPYVAWIIRIGFITALIGGVYYIKRRNKSRISDQ
jgi:hypothetical protein